MNNHHICMTRFKARLNSLLMRLLMMRAMTCLMAGVLAAVSLCGCSQADGSGPDAGDRSVRFGAYVGTAVGSRAFVADIAAMKQTGFGVFASSTGDDDFNPDPAAGFKPEFMCNQLVRWASSGDSGAWVYDPAKSWTSSKLSFFAYAPYYSGGGKTGIVGVSGQQDAGSPKVSFRVDRDVDAQTDLLFADASSTVNMVKSGTVQFVFLHALSRIGFSCSVDDGVDPDTHVTLKGITLRSSGLAVAGDLDLCSGSWVNLEKGDMAYTLSVAESDFTGGEGGISVADGKYLMLIPSEGEVPVEITVDYDVATADNRLDGGSVAVSNSLTTRFDHNFEIGKAYYFTLRVGMNRVEVGVDVADWENTDSDWKPNENKQNV